MIENFFIAVGVLCLSFWAVTGLTITKSYFNKLKQKQNAKFKTTIIYGMSKHKKR